MNREQFSLLWLFETALDNLGAHLLDVLKTTRSLPLLHLFELFPPRSVFLFPDDHLFYLNSDPLIFSPNCSCLKKKILFSSRVHFY